MRNRLSLLDQVVGVGVFDFLAPSPAKQAPVRLHPPRVEASRDADEARASGWLDRIDNWLWRLHQRSIEAHFAKARDVYELERMIRESERPQRPFDC